ncbi:MAG: hypothetical protein IPG67_06130 [Acidobacteria bacterium]|nr:hypothetical protein [Acidobacteriota bacterium]
MAKVFPTVAVKFKKDLKSVAAIGDINTNEQIKEVRLEPKMLQSDRCRR